VLKLTRIRYIQAKRELNEVGPGILLILALLWLLIYLSYTAFQTEQNTILLCGILFSVCCFLQLSRKDKSFVFNHLENPRLELYTEYVFLSIVFLLPGLFSRYNYFALFFLGMLAVLPFIRYSFQRRAYFKKLTRVISVQDFEWVSGVRKSFGVLIPAYVLATGLSWFRFAPLILLWIVSMTLVSFYSETEPLHILRASAGKPASFLKTKFRKLSVKLTVLYAPVLFINSLFNPEYWEVNALFFVGQIGLLCLAVCIKYTFYEPGQMRKITNPTLSVIALTTLIPYLLPLTLLIWMEYYSRAKQNLSLYLYDQHS
jgi:hypothetical protein